MLAPELNRNIQFRMETVFAANGNRVGKVTPDQNGFYCGMPLMVLGQKTQQDTYYDVDSVVNQITNPSTRFNTIYRAQKLYGEYGHPQFFGMSDRDKLERLMTVIEKNHSHLIVNLRTDAPSPDGTVVLRGDIKPTGPYGACFKESLDDPCINTAFSVRSFVKTDRRPDGMRYKTMRQLVTWDTVGPSGYASTDKAHAMGLESFTDVTDFEEVEIDIMSDGRLVIDSFALESLTNLDINEVFGVSDLRQVVRTRTVVESNHTLLDRFPTLYGKSMFDTHFRESR